MGGPLAISAQISITDAQSADEIRIGALCEMSGPASTIGTQQALGMKLLDRALRPIWTTPAGAVLAERGHQMLAEAMTTTAIVRRVGTEVLSELRVGIIASLSKTFLTQFAGMVSDHSGHPNLAIWSGLESEHCEALLERRFDIIISANPMIDSSGLERHELLTEKFLIIVPREYAEQSADITIRGLCESLPLVRFSARTLSGAYIEQHLRRSRIAPRAHLEFDVPGAIVESVSGGRGWAIINPLDLFCKRRTTDGVREAASTAFAVTRAEALPHLKEGRVWENAGAFRTDCARHIAGALCREDIED
jgi:DNA-binding transcriptional LysR family regulator